MVDTRTIAANSTGKVPFLPLEHASYTCVACTRIAERNRGRKHVKMSPKSVSHAIYTYICTSQVAELSSVSESCARESSVVALKMHHFKHVFSELSQSIRARESREFAIKHCRIRHPAFSARCTSRKLKKTQGNPGVCRREHRPST